MRLVRIRAPHGRGRDLAQIAFSAGIDHVASRSETILHADIRQTTCDVVEVDTSTPKAKRFIDEVTKASFFDPEQFSISVRAPRTVITNQKASVITRPLVEPTTDIFEELWQFSHVTYGFVGRILLGAFLLAFGIIKYNLLFMIAGLLFIPLLPLMLAMSFGVCTQQWRLMAQGAFALLVALLLLVLGGVVVGLLTQPPLQYSESNPLLTGLLISLVVGVAAVLASVDDAGRRELIGLAATAQIAIIPVWFGVSFVFGFPEVLPTSPGTRAVALAINITTIVVAGLVTYAALGMRPSVLRYLEQVAQD